MISLKLNSTKNEAWDLVVVDGDLLTISGEEYIAQKVKQILLLAQGDYFRNTTIGIPWFTDILGVKNPDLASIKTILIDAVAKNKILIELGVTKVEIPDLSFDKTARTMSLTMDIITDNNSITAEFVI